MPATPPLMNVPYEIASSDIVHENFGEDTIALNLGSGCYFAFNENGAKYWELLLKGHAPENIAPPGLPGTEAFLTTLLEYSVLKVALGQVSETVPRPTTWNLEQALEVQVHDDLSDLIVADPVHDVDESKGWPHLSK